MTRTTPDGVIQLVVDKVSTLNGIGQNSCEVEVSGVPWKINVCRHENDYLSAYIYCMINQSTPWSIGVDANFILVHSDVNKNIIIQRSDISRNDFDNWGGPILEWTKLIDSEKGFVKDDKITLEVRFWIYNLRGIRAVSCFDFSVPDESSDVALVIGGEKIYTSKQILAVFSPVLKAMFYGEFAEKDEKEIELKDIDRGEFIELLQQIYPSNKKITDDSAEYLLKLCDRFQIATVVVNRIEDFLVSSETISISEKLRIADLYRLSGLQEHCLSSLKTKMDFKAIKASPHYRDLSDSTLAALFERLLKTDDYSVLSHF